MLAQATFRIAFWTLIGLVLATRAHFATRVRQAGERLLPNQRDRQREGTFIFVFRLSVGILLIGLLGLYALQPIVIETLSAPIPAWLRWIGFALGLISLVMWTWVQMALGKQWSAQLQLRNEHCLITSGLYSSVRHPMYTAISGFALGLTLLTANGLFVILAVLVIAGLIVRVPHEESLMVEAFGDEYRALMRRTGRFFPKS